MADIKIETFLRWEGAVLRMGGLSLGWAQHTDETGWCAVCFGLLATDLPNEQAARERVEARVLERLGAKRIGEVGHD